SYLFEKCSLVPGNILVFRDLLQSPCCSFILHIRNISITREYAHPNDYCFNEIAADLRRLINIRTLRMQLSIFVDGINADAVFHTGFFTAFPHVTHLTLACSFLGDYLPPPPLVSVLSMFPALQTLRIRQSYSALDSARGLRSLEFGGSSVYPTLAWLNAVGHPPTVNSITLPLLLLAMDRLYPVLANQLLQLITRLSAPTLELFTLEMDVSVYRNLDWAALDAFLSPARFPRLRKVVFDCSKLTISFDPYEFLRGVLPLLEASGVLDLRRQIGLRTELST
ncbi:hypothetical protein B0H13DRAFT_2027602, partial [Mycena leptocephala]